MSHQLPKDVWDMARACYLWSGDEDEPMDLTHISQITSGDMFVLEASHPLDPLHGLVVCERVYRALDDSYKVRDAWQVDAERL